MLLGASDTEKDYISLKRGTLEFSSSATKMQTPLEQEEKDSRGEHTRMVQRLAKDERHTYRIMRSSKMAAEQGCQDY
jgi:hypothetical protein